MASQSSSSSDSMVSKIESAPEEFVRAVLIALCHKDSPKEKTMQYLETLESRQAEDDSSKKQSQRNKGKATSKLRICVQCEDTFREDENGPEDCPYHPGSSTLFSFPYRRIVCMFSAMGYSICNVLLTFDIYRFTRSER